MCIRVNVVFFWWRVVDDAPALLMLVCRLADIRGRQLIAGGSAQVWALEKINDRVLHKLSSGRHAQMAATVEQLQQQQRLLQEKLAAIRHTQVTEPAAGCLAAEALSSNHTAQAVSAAIQELLSQQDVKRLEDWRQLKQLLDRCRHMLCAHQLVKVALEYVQVHCQQVIPAATCRVQLTKDLVQSAASSRLATVKCECARPGTTQRPSAPVAMHVDKLAH